MMGIFDVDPLTAAHELAAMVRERVPHWTQTREDRWWRWTAPEGDNRQGTIIEVDGMGRRFVPSLPEQAEIQPGPSIIAFHCQMTIRVDLPLGVDFLNMRTALFGFEAIGALPREES